MGLSLESTPINFHRRFQRARLKGTLLQALLRGQNGTRGRRTRPAPAILILPRPSHRSPAPFVFRQPPGTSVRPPPAYRACVDAGRDIGSNDRGTQCPAPGSNSTRHIAAVCFTNAVDRGTPGPRPVPAPTLFCGEETARRRCGFEIFLFGIRIPLSDTFLTERFNSHPAGTGSPP